uniref:polynucleotide adenylyltransferase n=1 Tax=Calcidiscus leptoporus TaxID=127549 RepID=A0A7S0J6F5_9EUKA|eukprot:CAMPEP_0119355072 /NCGR_PEP_ID=MMETSP1334-20130426/3974_1 /TAXON_ID=127549 /ORGANISM="Calcidiscus leptoporus, Strain RCC1130" /LENGTH=347 /DNA_ID=CAMNT_0007368797 /DNA_START=17 /DNA_END=1060 /DNA_ORIENTATION=+
MSSSAPKRARVTPPSQLDVLSDAAPSEDDLKQSVALARLLAEQGVGTDARTSATGKAVLQLLNSIALRFVRKVGLAHGLSTEQAEDAGGMLLPIGSYALLDTLMPGADIDVLLLVPYFVERAHFFDGGGLCGLLAECDEVSGLHAVPDAFVPVLKFVTRGVPIDLLLTRLKLPVISRASVTSEVNERLLHRCLDETDAHSLNGARVALGILDLVPNRDSFRSTLRAVKLWVLRRGLGCFAMGYPGGVAWAILTARVCQLYPNAAPSLLFSRFFSVWAQWKFGANAVPVFLNSNIEQSSGGSELPAYLAAADWSSNNKRDRAYLMPVITPCRPRLCASHSVCRTPAAV